jgi:hypothetical protein
MKNSNFSIGKLFKAARKLANVKILSSKNVSRFKLSLASGLCILVVGCAELNSSQHKPLEPHSHSKQTDQHEHHASQDTVNIDHSASAPTHQSNHALEILTVYKSPTCGCCHKWIEHAVSSGFQAKAVDSNDLSSLKAKFGIAANMQSCHTAVSASGYVFEGHVPAKYIHQFLQSPPENARGLTVPAMPLGSPGMEVGDRFMPYQILLLLENGSTQTYAAISTYEEQF